MVSENVTLYTTSTFTKFVATATQNATATEITGTVTTSVNTTIGVLGQGFNILIVPIVVFFGIAVVIIAFRKRR